MFKTILITGGAGFIGSNFIPYFCRKYPEYLILNLDKLTYAGDLDNLSDCKDCKNYQFIHGDICDHALIEDLFVRYNIQGIINFAAESHVDNSINNPRAFIDTNITGTFNLIDVARSHWMNGPFNYKPGCEKNRFHQVSTDEVYGSLGNEGSFTESTPYAPNSPYSASKASADFIVRAFIHTYGMNATISNCSNNYGPKQHREKLIPTMIFNAIHENQLPIYGNGSNVRDWLYVLDHCKAVDLIFHKGKPGESYNVGCSNEHNNLEIVHIICSILDRLNPRSNGKKYAELISFVKDRAGHDFRYAIYAHKIQKELGWKPETKFEDGLEQTITWYISKFNLHT